MSEYQIYLETFTATLGERCRGSECGGWMLSDLDTWHECPNHPGRPHPEAAMEEPSDENGVSYSPVPEDPTITHAVVATVGTHNDWAIEVKSSFKAASETAKKAAAAGWKNVKVVRLTTDREKSNAEFQVYKVEDWSSDGDFS